MKLPPEFLQRMKMLLKDEYEEFLRSYEAPAFQGIRLNPLKCGENTLRGSLPFSITPAPFSPLSYYGNGERIGRLPAHHAGMFYSQEPSAAAPVTVLDPQPGEKILDLCAAPGGKSTQIAGLMKGEGILFANEIVRSRAEVLLSNIERLGVTNAVVLSSHPQPLCRKFRGYFDRVLVDAPCSGEGMFRRDSRAVSEWSPEHVSSCALRQRAVLDSAACAVREGGVLVYSTCTFSLEENEETVEAFLKAHPEFEQCPLPSGLCRSGLDGLSGRILPMDGGEGHFLAKLRKTGEEPCRAGSFSGFAGKKEVQAARQLYETLFTDPFPENAARFGDRLLLLPPGLPDLSGLTVLRAGVELGEMRGDRIEPAHALFQSRPREVCRRSLDFSPGAPELSAFLRGEEIPCGEQGYAAVCVSGVPLGFGKASGGRLKNRYPKGLRDLE